MKNEEPLMSFFEKIISQQHLSGNIQSKGFSLVGSLARRFLSLKGVFKTQKLNKCNKFKVVDLKKRQITLTEKFHFT